VITFGWNGRSQSPEHADVSEIKIAFGIPPDRPSPNIAPSWNLAPTDPAPVVYFDARDLGRRLEVMRWGLIPYWAKGIKIGFSTINARAEENRHQAGVPRGVPAEALPGAARQFLRMEKDRHRQAALCHCPCRPAADGHGRLMGDLALAGGGENSELHHHHHNIQYQTWL
jgi:hypothetical protein